MSVCSGFQRQVFKHVKILSERSKRRKKQKKNKGSVLVAESAYNAQNAQFELVMEKVYYEFDRQNLTEKKVTPSINIPFCSKVATKIKKTGVVSSLLHC